MKARRLTTGDKLRLTAGHYHAYDGEAISRSGRNLVFCDEQIGTIVEVVTMLRPSLYIGRHLIVKLNEGLIDLWTGQDSLQYRRVKTEAVPE